MKDKVLSPIEIERQAKGWLRGLKDRFFQFHCTCDGVIVMQADLDAVCEKLRAEGHPVYNAHGELHLGRFKRTKARPAAAAT